MVKLEYMVVESSGHSSSYLPSHIRVEAPLDQASRWSSPLNDQHQFLLLKLERPALVRTISFGKFCKSHVCNLKEFRVLAGSGPEQMFEVLHSGLRNDTETETFPFSFPNHVDFYCPVQYIKIIPVAAWGNNFNFSIWYVELRGICDLATVKQAHSVYQATRRKAAWRACLKFMQGEPSLGKEVLREVESRAGVSLDGPLVQTLHELVVERGDFPGAESLLREAAGESHELFAEYIREHVPYQCRWERLDREGEESPSKRGGHQMCWDPLGRRIYLFGGWDGHADLADLWVYSVDTCTWHCISNDTRIEGGPGPRSCHKVCIHGGKRKLFVLGRFVEQDSRTGASSAGALSADFWEFDLESQAWRLLSADVKAEGGPSLVYDHQMAVDEDGDLIYVFGGRVIATSAADGEPSYSGLYRYDIAGNAWLCLRHDSLAEQPKHSPALRSRIGHSMIFNAASGQLHILAGQRDKDYLADYLVYDVATDTVVEYVRDTSRKGGPEAGFTQRSTLDTQLGEIYLLTGLMKEKAPTQLSAPVSLLSGNGPTTEGSSAAPSSASGLSKNAFWVYSLATGSWTRLTDESLSAWPAPRFAHQLVYDPAARQHYLFGGNPGEPSAPKRRLNDFWRLSLERPLEPPAILRRAIFLIRRQRYYELCLGKAGSLEALRYLQNEVSQTVCHDIQSESEEFRLLSGWLFQQPTGSTSNIAATASAQDNAVASGFLSPALKSPILGLGSYLAEPADQVRISREQLFGDLAALLPKALRPPAEDLLDLVHPTSP